MHNPDGNVVVGSSSHAQKLQVSWQAPLTSPREQYIGIRDTEFLLVSHAQFWVFPLPRRNSKDALSEHTPAGGDLVGALAGLKVSPLQNPQPS